MAFAINHLSPVIFGEGISSETGARLNGLGCKKVLCVYDMGIKTDTIYYEDIKVNKFSTRAEAVQRILERSK